MADVSSLRRLKPASPHLPVSWYFDPEIFAREKQLLFDAGANYVGHELMVPNVGDYYTLAWKDNAQMLVRNPGGVELLSNVCRHRQAIMLEGKGNAENIVCPLHRWTYDLKGQLLGAPRFESQPCVKLHSTPLTNWNGLLFAGPRDPRKDLAKVSTMADWDFSGYVLDSVRIDEYKINWKTFVETYYPEEIVHFEREFVSAQQAAYAETAIEDNVICEKLDRGRRALYQAGQDDAGPYQSPMEDAEVHFHEWLHNRLGL